MIRHQFPKPLLRAFVTRSSSLAQEERSPYRDIPKTSELEPSLDLGIWKLVISKTALVIPNETLVISVLL
jgi:hypothetical protein